MEQKSIGSWNDKKDFVPYESLRFRIGEILVDESKGHISSEIAIEKIRKLMKDNEDGQRR